jgi:predicted PurR-regulated permease PerM
VFVAGVTGFLTKFVVTFMLAAFILIDLDRVNGFIRSLVPADYRDSFDEIVRGLDRGLAGVIRGQLLICLVNGVLTFIGLVIFEIKYAFLLALLAGVFSLIPIFGTILSSIPIVVIALVASEQGASLTPALAILGWIGMIHLIEANFLNPKIIGEAAHIHPVIVVFALLAGEHAFGLVGALLAVPVASMVQTVFLFARRRVLQRAESGAVR